MSIRKILEDNFALSTVEMRPSMEGFISNLRDRFKKKQLTKQVTNSGKTSSIDYQKFVLDVLLKKDPSTLQLVEGDVTLSAKASAYLTRNEKPVADPIKELNKDIVEYGKLVNQIKAPLTAYTRFLDHVDRVIEAFDKKDTGTEGFDELVAITDKLNKAAPKLLSPTLKEPSPGTFLGNSTPTFLDGDEFELDVAGTYDKVDALTLPALTQADLKALKDALPKLFRIQAILWELDDKRTPARDVSDQPYRRYSDKFLKNDQYADLVNKAIFFNPIHEVYFFGIVEPLMQHTDNLFSAFAEYAYKSIKHDDD